MINKPLAIVAFGENIRLWLEDKVVEFFDFDLELQKLLLPGGEAFRQVINYFGEEFLLKGGNLNQRKLWKFVYQDQHKLRILFYILEPLLINELQKKLDTVESALIVVLPGLLDVKLWQIFDSIIWLNLPKNEVILDEKKRLVSIDFEKYYDVRQRLYGKPKLEKLTICETRNELQKLVEQWLSSR